MGIRCLSKWIRWITPRSLELFTNWDSLRGKRVGVDILGLLYKCRALQQPPCVILTRWLLLCRRWEIEPLFVFDGKTPAEKRTTCAQRKKQREEDVGEGRCGEPVATITSQDRNTVKQFLYATGCLAINAEGEADTVLAALARSGEIAAIVSSDLDFLPRGCPLLLVPTEDADRWMSIRLQTVLDAAHLTYDAFVIMCVLMGTDYNPSIPTVSYQTAYWTLRFDTCQTPLANILKKVGIRDATLWERAAALLRGEGATATLSERQWDKYCAGPPPVEADSLLRMREDPVFELGALTDADITLLLQPWSPRPPQEASVYRPT